MNKSNDTVILHPLVLLSIIDHYRRITMGVYSSKRRVIGTIIGEIKQGGQIHLTNAFGLPFESTTQSSGINAWYVDHDFHEAMAHMLKRINVNEVVIGWYSTGDSISPSDYEIHQLFRQHLGDSGINDPLFLTLDMSQENKFPVKVYRSQVLTSFNVNENMKTSIEFVNAGYVVEGFEAEEVGVEHILRDVRSGLSGTGSQLSKSQTEGKEALSILLQNLKKICTYLDKVLEGSVDVDEVVMENVQKIFNGLPDMSDKDLIRSMISEVNVNSLNIYLGSMYNMVLALHKLVNTKTLGTA